MPEVYPVKHIFLNSYDCPVCGHSWEEESTQVHDKDCPACQTEYVEVTESETLDLDFYRIA